jgi:hypothetical protein
VKRKTPTELMLQPPPPTRLQGTVDTVGEPLRAPASGLPCVHWRLRIFEHVAPGMEFVHEVTSPEPLEIACQPDPAQPPRRVRLAPDHARIQAMPTLFRMGSPGALAVAQQFGMRGAVRVEEVVIRPGEAVEAEGVLSDPSTALSSGPFRTIDAPLELLQATVRMEASLSLRPVILPFALTMAAAVAGTAAATSALLHWLDVHPHRGPSIPGTPPEVGPPAHPAPALAVGALSR